MQKKNLVMISFYLEPDRRDKMREIAKGTPKLKLSNHYRRAIEEYIEREKGK